jgi:uncharacterized protein (TIGR02996 family)
MAKKRDTPLMPKTKGWKRRLHEPVPLVQPPDERALYRGIIDYPHDNTRRLVYADYVDERASDIGDSDARLSHAELIRKQIESGALEDCKFCDNTGCNPITGHCGMCDRGRLRRRCDQIMTTLVRSQAAGRLEKFGAWLARHFLSIQGFCEGCDIIGGFPGAVTVDQFNALTYGPHMVNHMPLISITIHNCEPFPRATMQTDWQRMMADDHFIRRTGWSYGPCNYRIADHNEPPIATLTPSTEPLPFSQSRRYRRYLLYLAQPFHVAPRLLQYVMELKDKTNREDESDSRVWLQWAIMRYSRDLAKLPTIRANELTPRRMNPSEV